MAIEYFCCYHSYARKLAKLSDQEVGRLFRALLKYSETGEAQELTGRESVAFYFIADDIDRAKEKYEYKCRQNSENAKSGRKRPQATASETSQYKYKDKDKEEENTPLTPLTDDLGFGEELTAAFLEWMAYKREKRQGYKSVGLKSLIAQVRKNVEQYGEAAVAALIRECMAANWQGIIWDKLGKREEGGKR